ncbi:hypothetical protein BpHYR1_006529 [Brachionus plicatilis]|uniref:Uncharacterized protein n=1 Tax=Brachionus plicatilis TaxID=10195 RepID=A0A3M7PKN3_BRAPC|nr:hypothetical protein BpHYR1_006529 [Brachionus plicatilis]
MLRTFGTFSGIVSSISSFILQLKSNSLLIKTTIGFDSNSNHSYQSENKNSTHDKFEELESINSNFYKKPSKSLCFISSTIDFIFNFFQSGSVFIWILGYDKNPTDLTNGFLVITFVLTNY